MNTKKIKENIGKDIKNNLRNINIKKLLRRILKVTFTIFIAGAGLYGLVWVPSQILKVGEINARINQEVAYIDLLSDDRKCKFSASQQLTQLIESMKKQNKVSTKEEQESYYVDAYNTCMYLEGRYTPKQPIKEESQESKKDFQQQEVKENKK